MTAFFLSSYRQNMWASSAQTTTVKKTEGRNAELSNSCSPQHAALLNSWVFRQTSDVLVLLHSHKTSYLMTILVPGSTEIKREAKYGTSQKQKAE